jgi:hypothetical protein
MRRRPIPYLCPVPMSPPLWTTVAGQPEGRFPRSPRGSRGSILAEPSGGVYGPPCSFLVRKYTPLSPKPSQKAPSGPRDGNLGSPRSSPGKRSSLSYRGPGHRPRTQATGKKRRRADPVSHIMADEGQRARTQGVQDAAFHEDDSRT